VIRLRVERTIAAAPESVFDWLAEPNNMTAAPAMLACRWVTDSPPGVGALRVAISPATWIREEITAYDPPKNYSYRIVRSFPSFDHEGGTLTFTPVRDGTKVDWETAYRHPSWVGGVALEAITRPALKSSFTAILAACAAALEG
jgi:uncharacterized protein YndB with AHSA1/START domain